MRPGKRCIWLDDWLPTLVVAAHCTTVPGAVVLATRVPFWNRRIASPSYVPASCTQASGGAALVASAYCHAAEPAAGWTLTQNRGRWLLPSAFRARTKPQELASL